MTSRDEMRLNEGIISLKEIVSNSRGFVVGFLGIHRYIYEQSQYIESDE